MTRKDIQFIAICIGAAALVVIAAHLLWPPAKHAPEAQVTQAQVSKYAYVSLVNSEVFHRPDCRYAKKISERNLTGFNSRADAINSGRRPFKVCKP
jgi:hypothetical protein